MNDKTASVRDYQNTHRSERMTERKQKTKSFGIRLAVFLILAAFVLCYTVYVLTPKQDYGICAMLNLYQQPENTIDVLAVGTSQTYGGVNTNVLWKEYGIAAYDLATAEQAYWVGYYQLAEALKTQTPRLVLLDTKASIYPDDTNRPGRTIMGTYGILTPSARLAALKECTLGDHLLSFVLAFPQLHSFYRDVNEDSFAFPPSNQGRGSSWKGYIEQNETEKHERPSLVWNSTKRAVNTHEVEYFLKILELCRDHDIPVMLVSYPYPDYANDHMYVNSLFQIAGDYGVTGINYNDPSLRFGLRYSSDFADWQHLNVKGSTNFSRRLAQDILEIYEIPDHRGEKAYESYDLCADLWYAKYPEYLPEK